MLNKMQEDALKVILQRYDGNTDLLAKGGYDAFPTYMMLALSEVFAQLKAFGVIASTSNDLSVWRVYLTPNGVSYFEDQQRQIENKVISFKKLPTNSKKLLDEILEAENPTQLLCKRVESVSDKEDEELRSILRELMKDGYIHISGWADDVPIYVEINNSARVYNENLADYEKQLKFNKRVIYNIGTINNQSGVLAIGDISNSTISIDNSVQRIESEIEKNGGEDKEALSSLLLEVKELIDNINVTRQITKNSSFFKRLSSHLEKHGWFYGEIVGLIGVTILQLL
jgi:hypothetical protein